MASRPARPVFADLIALVRRMEEAGIQLRPLTEGIDTSTANGRLTFHLFASLAEFERALVHQRTLGGSHVVDASGQAVCFVYGEDRSKGVSDTSLSVDETRRIEAGIARLPELLGRRRHPTR